MDDQRRLDSVDNDMTVASIAQTYLAPDGRVTFHLCDDTAKKLHG
jgi:hypothetical protein